jgi:glyoxylase-like metal-dependent hydrolase (beta-lactamase superfamily II)
MPRIIRAAGRLQFASVRATVVLACAGSVFASLAGIQVAGAAVPPKPAPTAAVAENFTLTEVKPGVFAAIARPGDESTVGNAGFVVGSEGVLVVDAFATARAAEQLLAQIRKATPRPIRWLVDTHAHRDHWGGNAVFAKAGAVVVATENARARILARLEQDPGSGDEKTRRLELPSVAYREAISFWLGDRRVDVFTKPGHTDGDSLVSVPDANVLFGGDLLQRGTVPNLSEAKTDAWVRTLDELARSFPSATLIPGHGAVSRPLDMRALRDFLVTIRLSVSRGIQEGKSGAALAEEVMPRLAPFRSWTWSEHLDGAVADVERELTGTGPATPTPSPAQEAPAVPTAIP